jgi:hypothetical protein
LELHSKEWQEYWKSIPAGTDVFVELSRLFEFQFGSVVVLVDRDVSQSTPFETLARSLSRLVLSVAYDSLARRPFGMICESFSKAFDVPQGLWHRYSGRSLSEQRGWPATLPIFGDHNPK